MSVEGFFFNRDKRFVHKCIPSPLNWAIVLQYKTRYNSNCFLQIVLFDFVLFSSPGELLSPLSIRRLSSVRPSVNFSHFNQLLWSHWANLNQTLVEWSLDGPLPNLCPVILTSNQDGHQAKNRKKGGWNFNCPLLL
jgi:hypothetical protein